MKKLVLLLFYSTFSFAQTYTILNQEKTDVSYRGLAIESDSVFLISGSKNTIIKTSDGGKSFENINPNVVQNRDFRDIEILNKDTYLVLGIDSPAYLLLTNDGGKIWKKIYENNHEKIFLNALYHNKTEREVYVIGDPINSKTPFILKSKQKNLQDGIH